MAEKKKVNLPQELVEDILLRLPVKTLLCLRSVCKSWLSLISDYIFVTSHFQLSSTHRRALINLFAIKSLLVDGDALHDGSAYASSSLDFFGSQSSLIIIDSCRGFVFLHGDIDFYLWNPSTGAHMQIPASPITHIDGVELLSGFGYDQSTDDYFIVSVFYDDDPEMKLMVFSLRANKWKPMEVTSRLPDMTTAVWDCVPKSGSHLPDMTTAVWDCVPKSGSRLPDMTTAVWDCVPKSGFFLNGSIHWIVYNQETFKNVIIVFDLKEMAMLEIALPDDFISISDDFSMYYDLLEVGGHISAWMNDLNKVKIYVMQEYRVHSSWTKIIEFSYDPVLHSYLYILCLTKCGDIVGTNNKNGLMKFNDKGKLLESLLSHRYRFVVYTESLFSLPSIGQT